MGLKPLDFDGEETRRKLRLRFHWEFGEVYISSRLRGPPGSLGLASQLGQTISPWSYDFPASSTQQNNFGVQGELPANFLIEVAMVASRTVGLPMQVPFNQLRRRF